MWVSFKSGHSVVAAGAQEAPNDFTGFGTGFVIHRSPPTGCAPGGPEAAAQAALLWPYAPGIALATDDSRSHFQWRHYAAGIFGNRSGGSLRQFLRRTICVHSRLD